MKRVSQYSVPGYIHLNLRGSSTTRNLTKKRSPAANKVDARMDKLLSTALNYSFIFFVIVTLITVGITIFYIM